MAKIIEPDGRDGLISMTRAPGSWMPTIFVGIGGSGCKTVLRLAQKFNAIPNLNDDVRNLHAFMAIDTDSLDLSGLSVDIRRMGLNVVTHNISGFDRREYMSQRRSFSDWHFTDWAPDSYKFRPGDHDGAGQIRIESRLCSLRYERTLSEAINQGVLKVLLDHDNPMRWVPQGGTQTPGSIEVYYFCSGAGGTGSGGLINVAALMNYHIRARNWAPAQRAYVYLPDLFYDNVDPRIRRDINTNMYTFLQEWDYVFKLQYEGVSHAKDFQFVFRQDQNKNDLQMALSPLIEMFLVGLPHNIHVDEVLEACTDAVFLRIFSPAEDKRRSAMDNLTKSQAAPAGWKKGSGLQYAPNFGTIGAAVLRVPVGEILEFCALCFAERALRESLTFHRSEDDGTTKGKGLTAGLDYSSQNFLDADPNERERMINTDFLQYVQMMATQKIAQLKKTRSANPNEAVAKGVFLNIVESVDGPEPELAEEHDVGKGLLERVIEEVEERVTNVINGLEFGAMDPSTLQNPARYTQILNAFSINMKAAWARVQTAQLAIINNIEAGDFFQRVFDEKKISPMTEWYFYVRLRQMLESSNNPINTHREAEKELRKKFHWLDDKDLQAQYFDQDPHKRFNDEVKDEAFWKRFYNKQEDRLQELCQDAYNQYTLLVNSSERLLKTAMLLAIWEAMLQVAIEKCRAYRPLVEKAEQKIQQLRRMQSQMLLTGRSYDPAKEGREFHLQVEVLRATGVRAKRYWRELYRDQFVNEKPEKGQLRKGDHYFDLSEISEAVQQALAPRTAPGGIVVKPTADDSIETIVEALIELGKGKFGSQIMPRLDNISEAKPEQLGLTIGKALELEAKYVAGDAGQQLGSGEAFARGHIIDKVRFALNKSGLLAGVSDLEQTDLMENVHPHEETVALLHPMYFGKSGGDFQMSDSTAPEDEGKGQDAGSFRGVMREAYPGLSFYKGVDPYHVIFLRSVSNMPLHLFRRVGEEYEDDFFAAERKGIGRGYPLYIDTQWEKDPLPYIDPVDETRRLETVAKQQEESERQARVDRDKDEIDTADALTKPMLFGFVRFDPKKKQWCVRVTVRGEEKVSPIGSGLLDVSRWLNTDVGQDSMDMINDFVVEREDKESDDVAEMIKAAHSRLRDRTGELFDDPSDEARFEKNVIRRMREGLKELQ
ncbi:MAG: tubulin-like doman-containing protein [Candidatus Lernaella stagnicola]|nr:tubulin-like doman-containing protein [Candidatus Lernaella stagnicola]